tara:strand:+ start:1359 stop:1667 length:309 start_codon:yes stop_codon:yes gene_type:complete
VSLKIKLTESLWSNASDGDYSYVNQLDSLSNSTLKMSIHPGWLELMDKLEVGDIVTTHKNEIGVVTRIYDITSLGMKKYEILIGNTREIFFSINLKKVDEEV